MSSDASQRRIPVAVLGATGLVGQRLIELLADHPWFELREVAASERSAGRAYREAAQWRLPSALPKQIGDLQVRRVEPREIEASLVFSALDAAVADEAETQFAAAGRTVVSNAKSHRMVPDVPLVVPEVNAEHLELLERQRRRFSGGGCIVTNPNCSVIGLMLAVAPIHALSPIERILVTTLQAASGAGYPGVPALDLIDNVIPHISGEEDKLETEPQKILGRRAQDAIEPAALSVSAHVHRVPVSDGHTAAVSLRCARPIDPDEARRAWSQFRGLTHEGGLPSAPRNPVIYVAGDDRPQPRLDRGQGAGMSVTVGKARRCSVLDLKFELLSHNTLRGAAGGTLLIAECLVARGLVPGVPRP